jgi:Transglutaminase-like superfamily
MKMTFPIWLLLLTGPVFSQDRSAGFSYIDRKVQTISSNDPETLAKQLTTSYQADKEKVRAIFRWITEHIEYSKKPSVSKRKPKSPAVYKLEEPDDTAALQPLTERMATKVLQDRRAVCEGYARLFKSLCDHAGIRSEIITGYANSNAGFGTTRFRSNHSWNAVYIDSAWHLLDVTWASGVILFPTGEFLKYYDDYYFLTPPEKFVKHHYPDDLRWTLLDETPVISEFRYGPYKQRSFVKYPIVDYSPGTGIIEAAIGDTIRLELKTEPETRTWPIASDTLWETIDLNNPLYAYVQPSSNSSNTKLYYNFPVTSGNIQWLHVMYNNDAVLRYRLNIKKELAKHKQQGN